MPNGYYFFPGDYVRDTLHLGWLEDLAYRRLIDLYYSTGKPLRNDRAYLMRALRAAEPEQQVAVDTVLSEFFELRADGWHQPKCDERLVAEKARSEGGRKGAREKWRRIRELAASQSLAGQSLATAPFPSLPNKNPLISPLSKNRKQKRPLPEDFCVTERVLKWAAERGIENVARHFEHFVGYARANGKQYADWDQALMNAVRDDWAKIGDGRKRVAI